MKRKLKVKVCPKCKSKDIDYKPSVDQAAFGFPPTFKCNKCGFRFRMISEKEIKLKPKKKKTRKKK